LDKKRFDFVDDLETGVETFIISSLCKLCLYYSWLDFNCRNITKHSVIASNALYVLMISSKECEQTWGGLSVFWYSYYL